ncbi:Fc.00g116290.m01.CDS01 [Cosmosporella sp. VM-42]
MSLVRGLEPLSLTTSYVQTSPSVKQCCMETTTDRSSIRSVSSAATSPTLASNSPTTAGTFLLDDVAESCQEVPASLKAPIDHDISNRARRVPNVLLTTPPSSLPETQIVRAQIAAIGLGPEVVIIANANRDNFRLRSTGTQSHSSLRIGTPVAPHPTEPSVASLRRVRSTATTLKPYQADSWKPEDVWSYSKHQEPLITQALKDI